MCWIHRWSKWVPKEGSGTATHMATGVKREITRYWQERECEKCGEIEQQTLEYPSDARRP